MTEAVEQTNQTATKPPLDTVLVDLHRELGGRLTDFAGHNLPVFYEGRGAIAEHLHTRSGASWFDVSHMLSCDIADDRLETAAHRLEMLTPSALVDLEVGQSRYCVLTNAEGGAIDDTIVTRTATGVRLVLNAGRADVDSAHLVKNLGDAVTVRPDLGIIAIQGPMAVGSISRWVESAGVKFGSTSTKVDAMAFMSSMSVHLGHGELTISRSGYTGEDGFEITAPKSELVEISRALLSDEAVAPAGLAARDSLRLEACLALYGHELNETISPIEAGLVWTIAQQRRSAENYLGASVIGAQIANGAPRRSVALTISGKRPVREGAQLFNVEGENVGVVTSGGWSPTLDCPIAMALVSAGNHALGSQLKADVRGARINCEVAKKPFVSHRYYR